MQSHKQQRTHQNYRLISFKQHYIDLGDYNNFQMLQNEGKEEGLPMSEIEYSKQNGIKLQVASEINSTDHKIRQQNFKTLQKIKPTTRKTHSFTQQQITIFISNFDEYRSKWTLYTRVLQKTEKQVKNLFYNSLRKLATRLANSQKILKKFQKNKIKAIVLHHLINMAFVVRETFEKMQMKNVQGLLVYRIKEKIFQYSFAKTDVKQQDILELSRHIRKLKFVLKNLKIGKKLENEKKFLRLAEAMLNRQFQQAEGDNNEQVEHENVPIVNDMPAEGQSREGNMNEEDILSYFSQLNNYYGYMGYHYFPIPPISYQYCPVNQMAHEQYYVKAEQQIPNVSALKFEANQ